MSDVWEYLPQVENAQNLYPNFSVTIAIVFTVVQESIKHCDSSKFHYHPALPRSQMIALPGYIISLHSCAFINIIIVFVKMVTLIYL